MNAKKPTRMLIKLDFGTKPTEREPNKISVTKKEKEKSALSKRHSRRFWKKMKQKEAQT